MIHYPHGVPVNCSLCQWKATAANYDAACRLADAHLEDAHSLTAETGVRSVPDALVLTESDLRLLKMLRIKES